MERRNKLSTRPKLRPYLWITGMMLTLWLGFVLLVHFKAQENNMELRDINSVTRWGGGSGFRHHALRVQRTLVGQSRRT
ncbi:hypothetical protein PCPL58_4073 [Pseudomonas cerasi]|uniref:Uncharacterized protein n=1 Tax=Pseudomonas cerasi TaxID=1583341 RepID=A0A193STY2_9PSED|nr:hypothetical protein PCPL58_4073 [Pseudomonas cerasi]SOS22391.1 hypothetical protein PL963_04164 [Pseudomonas cerasi]